MFQHADGDQAISRSSGGLTIHFPVEAGQFHDLAFAQGLIENVDLEALITDKAYDADLLIASPTGAKVQSRHVRFK